MNQPAPPERKKPRRGDVWWVAFDPSIGEEIRKTRPAIIMSIDPANAVLNRVQVVPVSSKVARLYPAEVYILLNGERRKAMADQVSTVSVMRLRDRIGQLSPVDLAAVEKAIRLQLGL